MGVAIKVENINKSFGKRRVLKNISLETYTGEVFGFLGPNGAGKTTLIKLIVGHLHIEEGKISICGADVEKQFEKAMENVGGIVENPECYKYMTGMQNLRQYARIRKGVTKERIDEVVELVDLTSRINEPVSKYSLGMRQRLGLAQALLHRPKVLVLDEPTNGIDPNGIKNLRDILKQVAHKENVCVFVSSHLLSEMQLMCDRVGIIDKGELISVQSVEELLVNIDGKNATYRYELSDIEKFKQLINKNFEMVKTVEDEEGYISLVLPKDIARDTIAEINTQIIKENIKLYGLTRIETRSLEDAFIELTQGGGAQLV